MTESEPPRVRVTLPGGQQVDGRLHVRRQRADGAWWYEVAIDVPVAAVAPIDGEDYDAVPTERAEPTEPQYVVVTVPGPVGGKPRLVLHKADCWAISRKDAIRVTDVGDAEAARTALKFDDTTACDVCGAEMRGGD